MALALSLASTTARADEPQHRMSVSGGFGYAIAEDRGDDDGVVGASGVFGKVEYIYRAVEWVTPRAYAGFLFANTRTGCDAASCDISANIGFLGIKGRLLAPIPYVAPFFELGIGGSIGGTRTRVASVVDTETRGAMFHIPFALGLAMGEQHQFELSFQYLVHPVQHQFGGALAFGVEFPLD